MPLNLEFAIRVVAFSTYHTSWFTLVSFTVSQFPCLCIKGKWSFWGILRLRNPDYYFHQMRKRDIQIVKIIRILIVLIATTSVVPFIKFVIFQRKVLHLPSHLSHVVRKTTHCIGKTNQLKYLLFPVSITIKLNMFDGKIYSYVGWKYKTVHILKWLLLLLSLLANYFHRKWQCHIFVEMTGVPPWRRNRGEVVK